MNEKSHVSMERHVCKVCGAQFDTGAILLDRRLRQSLERYTTTGLGLCSEHQALFDQGFIALVEVDESKSGPLNPNGTMNPENAFRTGVVAHLKRECFEHVFISPVQPTVPVVYVEIGVIEKLEGMTAPH